jgi:hypothetical protein
MKIFTALVLVGNMLTLNVFDNKLILLDDSQEYTIIKGCTEVTIPSNYKRIILNTNSTNVDKILMTDVNIANCTDANIENCCPSNSMLCIKNSLADSSEFKLNYCIDNTYLYACRSDNLNNSDSSTIAISTKVIKGVGCTNTELLEETECASIGIENCGDQHHCLQQCSLAECRTDTLHKQTKVYSMCVPAETSTADIRSKCKNHAAFENHDPEIYILPCTNEVYIEEEQDSSHKFFKLLLIVFGTAVLITFISSIYYRFKINLDGNPPFEPPIFCPQFIYPRN